VLLLFLHLFCMDVATTQAGAVDDLIARRMQERQITGLSLAIIDDGKIVKAQGYGFTDKGNKTPVTPDTLFQAASLSKFVAAVGAMRLVDAKSWSR